MDESESESDSDSEPDAPDSWAQNLDAMAVSVRLEAVGGRVGAGLVTIAVAVRGCGSRGEKEGGRARRGWERQTSAAVIVF